jgi:hypothetical protein
MDTIYRIIWHVILVQPFNIFRWITVQRLIGLEAIALFNSLTSTDRNAFYAGLLWAEQKLKEEDVKTTLNIIYPPPPLYIFFISSKEILLEPTLRVPDTDLDCKQFHFEIPNSASKFYSFPNDGHMLIQARITCTAKSGLTSKKWILDENRTNLYLTNSLMPFVHGRIF